MGEAAGTFTVRVLGTDGSPLSGVVVNFAISLGDADVNPVADTSLGDGSVSTALTLGTLPGINQITASVAGLSLRSSIVTAVAGAGTRMTLPTRDLRIAATRSAEFIGATVLDSFGNITGAAVTWQSRNTALVAVVPRNGNNATVQVQSRPGQTYVVGTAGSVRDSMLVSVLDAGSTPCTFAASPTLVPVGGSASLGSSGRICLRADSTVAEFVLVSHLATPAATAIISEEVMGTGIIPASAASIAAVSARADERSEGPSFEAGIRAREREQMDAYVPGARAWRRVAKPAALVSAVSVGDVTRINVNAFDFCARPTLINARVAAITNTAVILADAANPAGGFTDAEYHAFGMAMDTLVTPVDTTAFGSPTDIDGNGRVVILFTRAVNELTPRGTAGGVALGFFFSRDLLPKNSPAGACPGSNAGEMFYLMVPDTGGAAGDRRSKAFVENIVVSTIAHELQHLINASRRLYVNNTQAANEELWLNEGLSHIAEELVFYRASKLSPRQNIQAAQLQSGSTVRAMFDSYQRGNVFRLQQYLRAPDLNSPLSTDDLLATRGATWSFLRYVADQTRPDDGDFWHRLVNSPTTGVANLESAIAASGSTVLGLLADWSVSILVDDAVAGAPARFQQPSWSMPAALSAAGFPLGLTPFGLINNLLYNLNLRAGGSSYVRFAVPANQEALIQVRGINGGPLQPGVRLTIVRTK